MRELPYAGGIGELSMNSEQRRALFGVVKIAAVCLVLLAFGCLVLLTRDRNRSSEASRDIDAKIHGAFDNVGR